MGLAFYVMPRYAELNKVIQFENVTAGDSMVNRTVQYWGLNSALFLMSSTPINDLQVSMTYFYNEIQKLSQNSSSRPKLGEWDNCPRH